MEWSRPFDGGKARQGVDRKSLKDVLNHVQDLANNIASAHVEVKPIKKDVADYCLEVLKTCKSPKSTAEMVAQLMAILLDDLMEVLDLNIGSIPLRCRVETLQEELRSLKTDIVQTPKQKIRLKKRLNVLMQIEDTAQRVISLLYLDRIEGNSVNQISLILFELLESIDPYSRLSHNQASASTKSNYSRNHGLRFVDFLLEKLEKLLNGNTESISLVKQKLETVQREQKVLRSFLQDMSELRNEHQELKVLRIHTLDVSYKANYVVSLLVTEEGPEHDCFPLLSDVIEEIMCLKMKVTETYYERMYDDIGADGKVK